MGGIRRVARASAWILTGILGAIVCFYLVLIAINWRDRAPSEAVLLARALIENRPEVPASDNAYIYILGFSAPDEADPQQAGEARLAWLKARGYAESSKTPDPVPGRNMRADRPEHIQEAFRCASGRQSCIAEIEKNMPILAEWLDPNDVVLTRYRQLLDRTAWCELVPDDAMIPFPTYSGVFDGQRLHMVALWKQSGDAAAIRDGLQKDIVFWRTVLRSSDLLITKLIAVGALRQHFAYGNVVLRGSRPWSCQRAVCTRMPLVSPTSKVRAAQHFWPRSCVRTASRRKTLESNSSNRRSAIRTPTNHSNGTMRAGRLSSAASPKGSASGRTIYSKRDGKASKRVQMLMSELLE